ncbi:MAG: hypothetical protein IPM51_03345 [Sphingobacteriaceae bacterium]|nr:hypothetical protein [Sphingobacteriaceae bacterium]
MRLEEIGYISKAKGIKGELILKLEKEINIDLLKALFTEDGGSKAPHFIDFTSNSNSGLCIKLEGIDSIDQAKKLIGKKVFVDDQLIIVDENENWLVGYELIDNVHGSLGPVLEIEDNGAQLLMHLTYRNHQVILPLVEDFIEKTDEKNKQIYYNAPEGLIAIYLEKDLE